LSGEYFITIDVRNFECLLGEVVDGDIIPNEFGRIVENTWADLPNHYSNIELDVFQVMPNHFHGIIVISEEEKENAPVWAKVKAIHELPLPILEPLPELSAKELSALELRLERRKMLLFKVIGRFKMKVSKDINALRGTEGVRFWHRNYYEHIIRNLNDYENTRNYIINNPSNWSRDDKNLNYIKSK